MNYELRVWNDAAKMPQIKPQKAKDRLDAIKGAIQTAKDVAGGNWGNADDGNPDILIDTKSDDEGAIVSAKVSFFKVNIRRKSYVPDISNVNALGAQAVPNAARMRILQNYSEATRLLIKMEIKGNLYLPLKGNVAEAAKSMVGNQDNELKKKDTLLLSKWAEVSADADREKHYYRGVVLSILTKAGDFRVVTANNMYVESYVEDYTEGEFGVFELILAQREDANSEFKVDGLSSEEQTVIDQIKGALDSKAAKKAIEVAGTVGSVIGVAASIGGKVVETVEQFTGETEATRWAKYGLKTAGGAGSLVESGASIAKSAKSDDSKTQKAKDISQELKKMTDEVNDDIKDGRATDNKNKGIIPLSELEALYLSWIKADPKRYSEYIKMSPADKRKELEKASQEILDRAAVTKTYELSGTELDKALLALIQSLTAKNAADNSTVDNSTVDTPVVENKIAADNPVENKSDGKLNSANIIAAGLDALAAKKLNGNNDVK